MPLITPRPRHLLVAGFGLGLALTASSGTGCGARQRAAEAEARRQSDSRQSHVRRSGPTQPPAAGEVRENGRAFRGGLEAPADSSAVVEALQRKAQQVTREIDPASLARSPDPEAASAASTGEWRLKLGPSPKRAASPAPAVADAVAGANADTVAPDSAAAARPPAATPVEGPEGFTTDRKQVLHTAATTPQDEGAALTERLAQRVREYPLDLAAHMDYQFHRFAMGEPVPHMPSLSPLPQEDRDALVAMLDGMSNFRSAVQADPGMLLSKKVQPLIEMADRVRAQAELTLPVVALCSTVKGFGVYDPLPPSLKAGQDQPAILYVEVGNFSSRRGEKSQLWETKLRQEAVLYTEDGLPAWTDKSDIPLDTSRNRRHDFYVFKRVTLPRTLTIGRYFLKVTITDEQANRVAENSLPVQVVAQ